MSDLPFRPDWFSKPGDTLAALMAQREMSVHQLAENFSYNSRHGTRRLGRGGRHRLGDGRKAIHERRRQSRVLGEAAIEVRKKPCHERQKLCRTTLVPLGC